MYTLKSDTLASESLTLSILDPVADQERFGARYCTGGYIFQIEDARHGALLSGPTYPDSFNWFDGQGIPDAFNLSPLGHPTSYDPTVLVIGVGLCDPRNKRVFEFCQWDAQLSASAITFRTAHDFQGYALDLERTVSVEHRRVRSATRVLNRGQREIPIRWFPHPFYPHPDTDQLCRFNIPVSMPENAGFVLLENDYIARKGWPWTEGHYQVLEHDEQERLVILQRHPRLGLVSATCSYVPGRFPIWGNRHTFSWEPFFERVLYAGQEAAWWVHYDF
jgi:hypothetical protein